MHWSPPLISLLVMSGAASSTPLAAAAGCGSADASGLTMTRIDAMPIQTPLYVLGKDGQLFKVDPVRQTWQLISAHGLGASKVIVSSHDGRWIVYGGVLGQEDRTRYWVYDRHTGTERMILDYPAWGGRVPHFSPDSSHLALVASHGSGPGGNMRAPLVVMRTADWLPIPIRLPVRIRAQDNWTASHWSQDGAELLIMVRDHANVENEHYYRYRVADRKVEKASGKPAFDPGTMRSILGSRSTSSPDGKWQAIRGGMNNSGTWTLHLKGADGADMVFAKGGFRHCSGLSLQITGWLDNRHLVYRNASGKSFVFDTGSGRTAVLFDDPATTHHFTW